VVDHAEVVGDPGVQEPIAVQQFRRGPEAVCDRCDVVFLALPHKVSMAVAPEMIRRGRKVIDLSADFRFKTLSRYENYYQRHSAPQLMREAVYGLCEIHHESIRQARLVGNPGCYPTSVLLPLLAIAGWWYLRNIYLYGDPLGLKAMFDILPRRSEPPTVAELLARTQGVWRSAWAVFGWFNVIAEPWLYSLYTLLSLLGLLGLALVWPLRLWLHKRRGRGDVLSPASGWQLVVLVVWIVVIFLALLSWAQMRYPQGRLLFPALSAAAVLLGFGLSNWLPSRLYKAFALILATGLFAIAVIAPFRWLAPIYAAPAPLAADVAIPNRLDAAFGGEIKLLGYSIVESEITPGEDVHLTLYWQALQTPARDYSVFVHFTDDIGLIQAQRDSYPASGSLPTSDWQPGIIYTDEHLVQIPATASAPAHYQITVGLYDFDSGVRLPVGDGDSLVLDSLPVQPRVGDNGIPNPVHINFDDQIALIGFQLDRQTLHPTGTLTLDLWWQALSAPETDYVIFSHLVLPPDAVWAGQDAQPQDGAAPTAHWRPGDIIPDQHRLTLPVEAPAGVYFVEIGIYDPADFERLPVDFSTKGIVLGRVRVEAE
jgi:hypothetical protein